MNRLALRLAGAAVLFLAVASRADGQAAGKDLAMDFRTSTTVEGSADSGAVTGHIVSSPTKVRIDLATTSGRAPTPMATDGPVSMIVSDTGRTITYLDSKKSQYMVLRSGDVLAQTQELGVKMEYSGTHAKVDNLGAGPTIQGHRTSHYRLTMGTTMTIAGMGQRQSVKIASTTDYYFPTDIKSAFNAFASIAGSDMLSMLGSGSKEFADKMKAAAAKVPKAMPLRTSTTSRVTTQGATKVTRSNTEVTSVAWVNADPKVFEIPTGYTAVELPTMGNAPPNP